MKAARNEIEMRVIDQVIGERIQKVRKSKGMTKAEVCKVITVQPTFLKKIESGVSSMPLSKFVMFCRLTKTSPDVILSDYCKHSDNQQQHLQNANSSSSSSSSNSQIMSYLGKISGLTKENSRLALLITEMQSKNAELVYQLNEANKKIHIADTSLHNRRITDHKASKVTQSDVVIADTFKDIYAKYETLPKCLQNMSCEVLSSIVKNYEDNKDTYNMINYVLEYKTK